MRLSILTAGVLFVNTLVKAQESNIETDPESIAVASSNEDDVEFSLDEEEDETPLDLISSKQEGDVEELSNQSVYDDFIDAQENFQKEEEEEGLPLQEDQTTGHRKSVNYTIDFSIFESKEGDGVQVPYEVKFDTITHINYTFVNNEDHNTTLIGLTGYVIDAATQETVANLTQGRLNPVLVQPGANISFSQEFKLDIEEGFYYISPVIHAFIDGADQPMGVSVPPKAIDLLPGKMSFFNASFLSIVMTCGIMALSTYRSYQKANVNSGKNKPELKKLAKTAKINKDEWVPKEYKK